MKNKKTIILIVISVVILLIVFALINNSQSKNITPSTDSYNQNIEDDNSNNATDETETLVTENLNAFINSDGSINNSELAKSQQKIVSTGVDNNGDIYEIVANVDESYKGSELLIGVIKNSEWLIEPNNKCPYINGERWGWDKSGKNIDRLDCEYLSNGTFCNKRKGSSANAIYEGYLELWNVETNKYLYLEDTSSDYSVKDYSNLDTQKTDTFVYMVSTIYGLNDKSELYFLNTKTLDTKKIYEVITRGSAVCHQISEGLFYTSVDMQNKIDIGTFYDEKGNKVFDLNEYDTDKTSIISVGNFIDGKCAIINQLENGTRYKIIIDKRGKEVSNEKIN